MPEVAGTVLEPTVESADARESRREMLLRGVGCRARAGSIAAGLGGLVGLLAGTGRARAANWIKRQRLNEDCAKAHWYLSNDWALISRQSPRQQDVKDHAQ